MKTQSDETKMTLGEAARTFGMTTRGIQKAIKAGKLEPVRGGIARRAYWVTRASVEKILKGGAQ